MSKGILIDLTRCMGCRACQVACKEWNQLPAVKTTCTGTYQNPPALDDKTYTTVRFVEGFASEDLFWRFVPTRCMHCQAPACVSACLVKALEKIPDGPVVYYEDLCIGCRYCMIACPFDVPTFEYSKLFPRIQKCTFCFDRQGEGLVPLCAKTCPSEALKFGEREALLDVAKTRIYKQPNRYIHHVYGEHEAGGTSKLYISDVPFEKLGFRTDIPTTPYPAFTKTFMASVAPVLIGVPALLTGFHWLAKRREDVAKTEAEER
jgi:formate dehydrogenase iron-sulfur subunit